MLKTIGGMAINLASSAFNHNLAERSAQKQYDRQLEFWRLQNEYNNPSAQRSRMERAGFNPALIAGEVAGNNVAGELSNVPGNQVAQNGTINLDALNQSLQVFGQLEKLGADTDMMRRQIELSFIDEIIKNGEAYGIKLDNEQKKIILEYLATEKDVSLAEAMARINELNTRSDKNVAETGLASASTITEWFKQLNLKSDADYKDALTSTENQLRDDREALLQAQEDDYRSQIQRRIEQTAIEYAMLKVHQAVGKSQFFLNQALTDNEKRDFNEKIRTFDARQTALDIGNQLGLTEVALNEYADAVNDAWKTVMSGNPFKNPSEFFDAMGTVYADTLRNLTGNVSTFVPLDPSKMPTRNTRKIGYGANN